MPVLYNEGESGADNYLGAAAGSFYDDSLTAEEINEQAMKIAEGNLLSQMERDLMNPEMVLQTIDKRTGMPTILGKVDSEAGFNNLFKQLENATQASRLDDLLNASRGSASSRQQAADFGNPSEPQAFNQPEFISYQDKKRVPTPPQNAEKAMNILRELGLDFIQPVPTTPPLTVKVNLSGAIRFSFPIACNKIVIMDRLVVLVSDKRLAAEDNELDLDADPREIFTHVVLPDGTSIPVVPPMPSTLVFDIGMLHCSLFFRLPEQERSEGQEAEQVQ